MNAHPVTKQADAAKVLLQCGWTEKDGALHLGDAGVLYSDGSLVLSQPKVKFSVTELNAMAFWLEWPFFVGFEMRKEVGL